MFVRFRNPRLRFIVEPDADAAAVAAAAAAAAEPKFPANTPLKDMTPDQQSAFHQNKARKLEDALKSFNGLTPEQAADAIAERDALRKASLTAPEKAIEEAREAGRAEVRTVLGAERFKTALTAALAGRTADPAALLDLDRSQFIDGDKPKLAAIKAWVDENSTAATTDKPAPVRIGQGYRAAVTDAAGDRGRAEAAKRFGTGK